MLVNILFVSTFCVHLLSLPVCDVTSCVQSGAVMAVLAAVCTKVPEAKLGIILLPFISFTAANVSHTSGREREGGGGGFLGVIDLLPLPPPALKAIIAMDTAGRVLGWGCFDHGAHRGGGLFGV